MPSSEITINAKPREGRGKEYAKKIRRTGLLPAVLYGAGKDPVPLTVDHDDIISMVRHKDTNIIINLSIEGSKKAEPVMIHEFQIDPVHHTLMHIDFIRVVYGQSIHVTIPIELQGIAPGTKVGGFLDFAQRSLNVECLPSKIPPKIMVDISKLNINDHISVEDLDMGEDVKVLDAAHNLIVRVSAPKVSAADEAEVVEEEEKAEPELIARGKKEEEED
ncbi:MAG TPA: 50S ribosomal protein L25 [Thermoanaerobaculia bacterium]|nr:50S ribosomal protein L25 [Thermoanaerobaculia bacterium]HUM31011.1 50S ribosomal protein L25 [Thermoanaerobaculia bacterium]HXK69309.1 50S ribosomal protein L25 [Thermoanaerobaculia bacterium]